MLTLDLETESQLSVPSKDLRNVASLRVQTNQHTPTGCLGVRGLLKDQGVGVIGWF